MVENNGEEIKRFVRDRYGDLARQHAPSCCACGDDDASGCCSATPAQTAHAQKLYSREELDSVAENIPSLGCGNPVALAELEPNETVLDLGSGGGLDCLLAARRVGPQGTVIGLDMTPDMVQLARVNADKLSLDNVKFRLGEMEHMPVESDSVDVIISNCVVNLSPDKDAVFREAFRVLKPGGRLCVSDIVTRGELPAHIRDSLEQWACCIGGALDEKDYLKKIGAAGFVHLEVAGGEPSTTAEATGCCGEGSYLSRIASITVKAFKPE